MYTPKSFQQTDQDTLHRFIEQHSFGLLISNNEGESVASHLPLLLDRTTERHGCLIGHMARVNSQWKQIDSGKVLVVFHGPHAYISPSWYQAQNVVPTWDYVAVHVYGTLRLIDDPARLLDTLRRTVDKYESNSASPWSIDDPDAGFVASLIDAIVGFEIEIDRMEGKWKLSQNHDRQRRERVAESLRERGGENDEAIAALMSQPTTDA